MEVTSDLNILSWQESDLLERSISEKKVNEAFSFDIKPYEIKTFIVKVEI